MYPTFVWSVILWLIHDFEFVGIKWYFDFGAYDFWQYIQMLLYNPTYVVWFLWVIFICTLVISVSYTIVKMITCDNVDGNELHVIVLACMFFTSISNLKFNNCFGIVSVRSCWIYFIVGYGLNCLGKKDYLFRLIGIEVIICAVIKTLGYFGIIHLENTAVDSWMGMGIIYIISAQMVYYKEKIILKQFVKKLSWLGRNSLPIYLFQLTCLNIGYGTGTVRIITIFISSALFSVFMTVIVKKSKILSAVLLGNF